MGPIVCPETSVRNYHKSLRNNSEERSYQIQIFSTDFHKVPSIKFQENHSSGRRADTNERDVTNAQNLASSFMTKTEQKKRRKKETCWPPYSRRLGTDWQSDTSQCTPLNTTIHIPCYKHEALAYKLRKWRHMESAIKYSNQKLNYRQFFKFIYK